VILPTDTLYALACQARQAAAARAVRAAKGRDDGKPLPLVAGEVEQLDSICGPLPEAARRLAACFWPGPLTLVLPATDEVPSDVTSGGGTIAVRVPAHDFLRRLCLRVGPLVSTSANRSGHAAAQSCTAALAEVGPFATLAVDGGVGRSLPSTIVDMTVPEPRLLRAGALAWAEISAALRGAPA